MKRRTPSKSSSSSAGSIDLSETDRGRMDNPLQSSMHTGSSRNTPATATSTTSSKDGTILGTTTSLRGGSQRPSSSRRVHHDRSTQSRISRFVARAKESTVQKVQVQIRTMLDSNPNKNKNNLPLEDDPRDGHNDRWNYALLILLYTLQGIPMGLSASIPFLLQEKITKLAASTVLATTNHGGGGGGDVAGAMAAAASASAAAATRASYNANAIFALCSWPFSLKLLWAPIVDAMFFKSIGRRKSWLVPVQTLAGLIMVGGANFVEGQLGLSSTAATAASAAAAEGVAAATHVMNVKGVTTFFFVLYFLMATQDIAVDGWALTMLSKRNRGRGPICNSIGQNIGYFLSFVGFLALNDVEASETLWRPLLRLPSNPTQGLVRLRGFLRFMGFLMLGTTVIVALFKRELPVVGTNASTAMDRASLTSTSTSTSPSGSFLSDPEKSNNEDDDDDDDAELDASTIGLKETYHRLWAVCQLPAVRMLFLVLVTYRLPVALSDNVKFLKAVEYGLSKSTTALLSPTLILPLGILVPIIAHKVWHKAPLQQFTTAYRFRVTLIPLLDLIMLHLLQSGYPHSSLWFWMAIIASTAGQAICNSLQFNAQMIFFASRVDPAIGGSYMTLLNTAANLGGTWPASFVMWLIGILTRDGTGDDSASMSMPTSWLRNPYVTLQVVFSAMGIAWLMYFGPKIQRLASLPGDAWRTHLLDDDDNPPSNDNKNHHHHPGSDSSGKRNDLESGDASVLPWQSSQQRQDERPKNQ